MVLKGTPSLSRFLQSAATWLRLAISLQFHYPIEFYTGNRHARDGLVVRRVN